MLSLVVTALLSAGNPQLLIAPKALDSIQNRYIVDTRSKEAYSAGHIPDAVRVDSDTFSETRNGVAGLLKPIDQLKELLEEAGIAPDKHIVLYSSMKSVNEFRTATRLFWILDYLGYPNVAILDGGYERWVQEGLPVQTEPVAPERVSLPKLEPNEDKLATEDEVLQVLEKRNAAVLDIRSPEDYTGESKKDDPRAGHIPGAQNLPAGSCIAPTDQRLQSVEAINDLLKEKDVSPEAPIVTYCNTGRQASVAYFMLRLMGRDDVSLYDGSMAEWGKHEDRPVVKGQSAE